MGKVAIQNIKILHKRYSYSEWINGKTNAGTTLTLDNGELGFDTTNKILRMGTSDGCAWSNAAEIGTSKIKNQYYDKSSSTYVETVPTNKDNYFVAEVAVEDAATGKTLIYRYKEVIIPDAPKIKLEEGAIGDTPDGMIKVVGGITNPTVNGVVQDHTLQLNKTFVPSQDYVDGEIDDRVSPIEEWIDLHAIEVTKEGNGSLITGIKSVETANGIHSVVLETGDVVMPTASGSVTATGSNANGRSFQYVKSVSLGSDSAGNHELSGTTDSFTVPGITGEVGSNDQTTKIVTRVGVDTSDDHKLVGKVKEITNAEGSKVSVTGTDTQIKIDVDLSTYATKSELNNAVNGATHYAGVIEPGTSSTGALDISSLSDMSNGAFYLATRDGYIKDATHGVHDATHKNAVKTAVQIKKGDSVLLHLTDTESHWDVITAGDDVEYRPIYVNDSKLLSIAEATALNLKAGSAVTLGTASSSGETGSSVTINHADTSSQGNITKTARTYIDSVTLDDYGHVTGLTVGTESDQNASGGETAGIFEVISKAVISKDSNGDIVLDTDTKTITVDSAGILDISEEHGDIQLTHKTTNVTVNQSSGKTLDFGDSFNVIETETYDVYGHLKSITPKTLTLPSIPDTAFVDTKDDTDTRYDISTKQSNSIAGQSSVDIVLTPTLHDVVAGTSTVGTPDKITISSEAGNPAAVGGGLYIRQTDTGFAIGGQAAEEFLGLIKVFSSLNSSQTDALKSLINTFNPSSYKSDRLYGVNTTYDGKAFVEVPWVDTHAVAKRTGGAVTPTDLYAFDTDEYGHISSAHAITTIDGNIAE